jgi:3',5'-cyclic AMP phosphodiesterase CpdA
MPTIRILHASDLHFADVPNLVAATDRLSAGISLPNVFSKAFWHALTHTALVSSYDPTRTLALAEFINNDYDANHIGRQNKPLDGRRNDPLDAIVLTGDIATTGLTDDLKCARRFLEDAYDPSVPAQQAAVPGEGSISRVLTHDGCSCTEPVGLLLMPGNHDRLRPSRKTVFSPGGGKFDTILGVHWNSPRLQSHGPDVRELKIDRGSLSVSVIAADFNLKHKKHRDGKWWNKYAQGRVYRAPATPDILGDLERATASAPEEAVVLWATHFPPSFPSIPPAMKLIDDADLIAAANQHEVSAVLSGHTHEPVRYRTPWMDFEVLCAGTASQHHTSIGHHFHVIEISGNDKFDATISVEHYEYAATHAFVQI